jgi:hypothetical protein
MIICFKVVFNLVLSNSKTHLIVKLETFPHLRRARAGFGWGRGAVCPPRNTSRIAERCVPHPELPICDSFKDNCRLFLLSFKLAGKQDRTGFPGLMLEIYGADAAGKAKVSINL